MGKEVGFARYASTKPIAKARKDIDMARCDECLHFEVCEALEQGNGLMKVSPIHCGVYKPTADVVPKSEVDLYRRQVDELEDELASTYDKLENAKAEVAREIFEKIESLLYLNQLQGDIFIGKYFDADLENDIAELKKKYTGENNNEN